ncbi:hypothetical protein BDU57DRAFT_549879 [Ampelomyces quisqualis]|uniref:Rhodopsin domain-containing protein n=1 Tax=Ampelomyces quisqualis TaxID=50730 RepID=A0A6A5QIW7_AMPQU|nr:hypothetical protein BDU57DRAFT_549879 [Ampelomyces quisqualis]
MEVDLDGPAMLPPAGVQPDFVNTGGQHTSGYIWLLFSGSIATLSVLARVMSCTVAKRFHVEDYLMIAALGLFSGIIYMSWKLVGLPGMWTHQWNIQLKSMSPILYHLHMASVFYGPIAMCIKVAILTNWLRIFVPRGQRNFTFWMLHVMIWSNVVYYIITTITEIFRCWPREKIWDLFYEGGTCTVDVEAQNFATSVINFVSDTTILALPQWMIWKLNMSKKKRWGLSLLFVIGVGAWSFGVARTVYFVHLVTSEDSTYNFSGVAIFTIWECVVGFMVMGIPAFPRAFKLIPGSTAVITFFRSLTSKMESSKAKPFQRMYKPKSRRRRSVFEISEMDTDALDTVDDAETNRTVSQDTSEVEPGRNLEMQQVNTV